MEGLRKVNKSYPLLVTKVRRAVLQAILQAVLQVVLHAVQYCRWPCCNDRLQSVGAEGRACGSYLWLPASPALPSPSLGAHRPF